MSLIFFDGFDNEPSARIPIGGNAAVGSGNGRNGTDCIRVTDNEGPSISFPARTGATVVTIGFAVYVESSSGFSGAMLRGLRNGNEAWSLKHHTGTGALVFNTVTADPASSSVPLPSGAWHYLELVINSRSSGGSARLYVDGVEGFNFSGDTTFASDGLDLIQFRGDNGLVRRFDDVYILDDAGSSFNTRLGDVHVKRLAPTAQGNYAQGVGSDGDSVDNYLLVDEAPANEADNVSLLTAGARDSYAVANLAAGEIPLAVKVAAQAGDGDGSRFVDGFLRMGGTDYDAGAGLAVASTYNWRDFYFPTNPATAGAWAEDALDGAEIGVRRSA